MPSRALLAVALLAAAGATGAIATPGREGDADAFAAAVGDADPFDTVEATVPPPAHAVLIGREGRGPSHAAEESPAAEEPRPADGAAEPRAFVSMPIVIEGVDAETGRLLDRYHIGIPIMGLGHTASADFRLPAPRGHVAWDSDEIDLTTCRYSTSFVATYPFRREVPIRLRVSDFDGPPPEDLHVSWAWAAGRSVELDGLDRLEHDVLRVHGIPYFRGEKVSVTVSTSDRPSMVVHGAAAGADSEPARTLTSDRSVTWSAVLSEDPWRELEAELVLPAPETLHGFSGRGGRRSVRSSGCGCGSHLHENPGSLLVTARRRDGSPASNAAVFLHYRGADPAVGRGRWSRCDAAGRVRFDGRAAGPYCATFDEPGLVSTGVDADVVAGEEREVLLVEGDGAEIDVVVVDGEGRGLPFATLVVKTDRSPGWIDVEGGVQRIDPFTDHRGRRTLNHVSPGGVTIEAAWGSRSGKATLTCEEGRRGEVRIVLP